MSTLHAIIYGLVQGLTEYLPVSSSAHLTVLPYIFGEQDPGLAFDVFLHAGTLLATLIYFWKDWLHILKHPRGQTGDLRLSWGHFIIATLPAAVLGVVLNHWIKENTRELWVVYMTLPLFGFLLWWADRKFKNTKQANRASLKDVFTIGCAQALALIPGVSRSGITITAARMLGFEKTQAARLSFLISFPVILGAAVFELRHWSELVESASGLTPLAVATIAAALSGVWAIRMMIRWVGKIGYGGFAIYRTLLALILYAIFRA